MLVWREFFKLKPIGLSFVFVFIATANLLFLQLEDFAKDPGLGWHLATGQWIFENKSIPSIDPFLSADQSRPWIVEQWLGDLILYSVYQFGSWPLLYCFGVLLYLTTFLLILYPLLVRLTGFWIYSALATCFAFKLGQIHFILRPVLFNYPLFALTLLVCCLSKDFINRHHAMLAAATFFLFAFWANIHPSFIFGLFILGLRFLAEALDWRWWQADFSALYVQRFSGLFACALLGTLCNPYGLYLYPHILWHGQSEIVSKLFNEWQPLNLRQYEGTLFIITLLLTYFALLFKNRLSSFWFLGLLVLLPWALSMVRILPFYIIFCAPLLVWGFEGLQICLQRSLLCKFPRLLKSLARVENLERRCYRGTFALLVIFVVLLWQALGTGSLLGVTQIGFSNKVMPQQAVNYLLKEQQKTGDSKALRVLNDIDWGGYITWVGQGRVRAYIDDRSAMLGDTFLIENIKSLQPDGNWQGYFEKSKADFVLLRKTDPLNYELQQDRDLRIGYQDRQAVVYDLRSWH